MYNKYIYMEFKPYNIYLLDAASEIKKVLVFGNNSKDEQKPQLYPDDSILNVKHKIVNELEDKNIDNYCFFYKTTKEIDLKKKFEILSNNNHTISKRKNDIFMTNHNIEKDYDEKEEYGIEDVLKLEQSVYEVTKSFDNEMNIDDIICDPLKNSFNYIETIKSKNSSLLFENGEIVNNEIFCVHILDYIQYAKNQDLDLENMITIYYHSLNEKGVVSEGDIIQKKEVNKDFLEYNKIIDSHIDFYNNNVIPNNVHKKCNFYINSLNFVYYTKSKFTFPHEVFFKQIHASDTTPFIKYNPGSKMENIYRLYCPHKDVNGKKIPAMSRKKIFKFMDSIKKNKYISFIHIEDISVGNTTVKKGVLVEINEHGHIFFNIEKINASTIDEIHVLCKSVIDKIISQMIKYFDPTKSIFEYFDNLYSENIEIVEIKYKMLFDDLNKEKIERCIEYFPSILHGKPKAAQKRKDNSIYQLNYKRVSNYNKFSDVESEIIELFNKQIDYESIIQIISFYFDDYDQTKEFIDKVIDKINVDSHLDETGYITKVLRIKSNPGFNLTIDFDEQKDKFYIETSNINHLDYLPFVNVYVLNFLSFVLNFIDANVYDTHFSFLKGKHYKDMIVDTQTDAQQDKLKLKDVIAENTFNPLQNTVQTSNNFDFSNMLGNSDEEEIDFDKNMEDELEDSENEEESNEQAEVEQKESINEKQRAEESDQEDSESESEDEEDDFSVASANSKAQQPEEQEQAESDDESEDEEDDFSVASANSKAQQPEEQEQAESDDESEDEEDDFSVASANSKAQQPEEQKQEESESESEDEEDDFSVASANSKVQEQQESDNEEDNFSIASTGGKKRSGGSRQASLTKTKNIKNMKNYKLTPNPFSKKIEKHQPLLYVKEEKGNYKLYSRSCPWSDRRTPVLLSQEEKDYIDTHHKDSYDYAVQYGTNPLKEKYWYICPRYWNVRDGVPVKEEDVDRDAIIDENAKTTDLSKKYIFQFSKKGKYTKKIPGFLESSKHEHGMFMPCCFNITDGPEHKNRLKEVENQMKMIEESGLTDEKEIIEFLNKKGIKTKTIKQKIKTKKDDEYILSENFFPLDYGRYGLLPISLERFIGFDCKSCFSDKQYKKMKHNTPCLLRYGVENDIRKSFLACLAMLFLKGSDKSVYNMIQKIKDKVTIDNILTFHNGNIPKLFYKEDEIKDIDLKHYEKYKIYEKLKSNEKQLRILINGYENFIKYIEDNREKVDYYYIWDIVTSGILNEYYENVKLNLIIIKDNNDDITNNLSILCPTHGHSKYFYNHNRLNIVIYHKNEYYEPIVEITDVSESKRVTRKINKFFNLKQDMLIYELLNKININISSKCELTMPNEYYEFEENIDIHRLLLENSALLKEYKIIKQVINYDNKVIGVQLRKTQDNRLFFIPLKQSALVEKISVEVINDSSFWKDYSSTKSDLIEISNASNGNIKCKPKFKIVEDGMIVGFLTNGNQFVRLEHPIQNDFEDEVHVKDGINYDSLNDYIYENYGKEDTERNEMVQNMKLEKHFYNAYCDTMKMIINQSKNISVKNDIIQIIKNKEEKTFEEQHHLMYDIIDNITQTNFLFTLYDKSVINHLTDINICSKYSKNQKSFCSYDNGILKLMIPEINLYTKEKNREKYVSFLTYDILLNTYIQNKILRDGYNIYDNINYQIKKDEVLILEKLLRKYFKNLKEKVSDYIQHDVFENMIPDELVDYLDYKLYNDSLQQEESEEEKAKEDPEDEEQQEESEEEDQRDEHEEEKAEDVEQQENEPEEEKATKDPEDEEQQEESEEEKAEDEEQQENEPEEEKALEEPEDEDQQEEVVIQSPNIQESINEPQNSENIHFNEEDSEPEQQPNNKDPGIINHMEQSKNKPNQESDVSIHNPSEEQVLNDIDEVLQQIPGKEEIQIREDELEKSKTTNMEEYKIKSLPNNNKIALKFPKKMSKIRLNIADIRHKIKAAKKKKELKQVDLDHTSVNIDPEIYDTLFEKGLEAPKDNISTTTEKIKEIKETTKRIKMDKCIQVGYLTSNWKKFFPKLTSRFTFSNNPIQCNYNLMMYILKSHNMNLFKNINAYTIKQLLIKYYSLYLVDEETRDKIFAKFVKEGKKNYVSILSQGATTIETVVHDDNYKLTETDYLLLSYHLKIPIIICYQSKNKIKISHFEKNNIDNNSYYFIKASVQNIMYLFSYKQKLHIHKDALNPILQEVIETNTFENFENYLFTKMRK
jgi:hypothetical protein